MAGIEWVQVLATARFPERLEGTRWTNRVTFFIPFAG